RHIVNGRALFQSTTGHGPELVPKGPQLIRHCLSSLRFFLCFHCFPASFASYSCTPRGAAPDPGIYRFEARKRRKDQAVVCPILPASRPGSGARVASTRCPILPAGCSCTSSMIASLSSRQGRVVGFAADHHGADRKSTRLNSSHVKISYAVFC